MAGGSDSNGAAQKEGLSDVSAVAALPSPTAGMMNQGTGAMHESNTAPMPDSEAHRAAKSARLEGQADVSSQPGGGVKTEAEFDQLSRGSLVSAPPPATSAIYAGEAAPVSSLCLTTIC